MLHYSVASQIVELQSFLQPLLLCVCGFCVYFGLCGPQVIRIRGKLWDLVLSVSYTGILFGPISTYWQSFGLGLFMQPSLPPSLPPKFRALFSFWFPKDQEMNLGVGGARL